MAEASSQLTLVAFIHRKPQALVRLLTECQGRIAASMGDRFEPYSLEQMHATLVGFERAEGTRRDNANLKRFRDQQEAMDIDGYVAWLREDPALPLAVRFGGFARGERPFESRGQTPWERTFSIQGHHAVLIGWPLYPGTTDRVAATVERLRRAAETFGILHAYHRGPEDADNDLYLRLGTLPPRGGRPLEPRACAYLEAAVREQLAARPVTVPLTLDDLRIARYRDTALPAGSTRLLDPQALAPGWLDDVD